MVYWAIHGYSELDGFRRYGTPAEATIVEWIPLSPRARLASSVAVARFTAASGQVVETQLPLIAKGFGPRPKSVRLTYDSRHPSRIRLKEVTSADLRMHTWIWASLIAGWLVATGVALWSVRRSLAGETNALRNWQAIFATIVDAEIDPNDVQPLVTIEFETATGRQITTQVQGSMPIYEVDYGSKIEVLYDPSEPTNCVVRDEVDLVEVATRPESAR
jgi:hypothetical protein